MWLLVVVMLTILWILVAPNVDLDPAPPLNLEAFFFFVMAICAVLESRHIARPDRLRATSSSFPAPAPALLLLAFQAAPLRC